MKIRNGFVHASGRGKNVCTSAVLQFFGIGSDQYHYAEDRDTVKQVLRRHGMSVRSRMSALRVRNNVTSIGKLRIALRKYDGSSRNFYYVGVVGHAMVLNGEGRTIVDTAPVKRDARKVRHISIVAPKGFVGRRREFWLP